jgi:hypothetical protein
MAWPATDFTKRSFADLAGDLSALCLAVNEREAALALTETVFTIQDGTTKARPTTADLSGFTLGDNGDTDKFRDTIIEVQDAAKSLVDGTARERFTTTSGGSTFWTHTDLIDDIDITDNTGSKNFSTTFDWWDSNVWERLRKYIDKLIYCIIGAVQITDTSAVSKLRFEQDADYEQSWDDTKAGTKGDSSLRGSMWAAAKSGVFGCNILSDFSVSYDTSRYSGSVIGDGSINTTRTQTTKQLADIIMEMDGNSETLSNSSSSVTIEAYDTTIVVSANKNITSSVTTAETANAPFSTPGFLDRFEARFYMVDHTTPSGLTNDGLKFWLDISGELTDQD